MRFSSISSFTFASVSGAAITTSLTARDVLASVQNDGSRAALKSRRAIDSKAGDECVKFSSLKSGVDQTAAVDMGILGCSQGFICLDDDTSSTGSRCAIVDKTARRLEVTKEACVHADGSTGYKCEGGYNSYAKSYQGACYDTDKTKVGCGSCNG